MIQYKGGNGSSKEKGYCYFYKNGITMSSAEWGICSKCVVI